MSQAYRISGGTPSGGILGQVTRIAVLAAAAIGGLFMLIFSAAFALFAIAGIAVIGALAFGFFWLRAKILGRPFGPKARFEQMKKEMEAQGLGNGLDQRFYAGPFGNPESDSDVIDLEKTPDGWSVER